VILNPEHATASANHPISEVWTFGHMATPVVSTEGPLDFARGRLRPRAERPSLHDKPLIVERRSLRSALRAPVETTGVPYATALPEDGRGE